MSWDKPKSGRGWLLLLVPPASCVILTLLGGLIDPKEGNWMGWSLAGLAIATISSFLISIWLARVNESIGGKLGTALLCFFIFMVVNGAVSFAGCAIGSTMLPGLTFH
jgi:hypothetical protein